MATTIALQAAPREVFGKKVKALREAGLIPAEIYGRKTKSQSIQVPVKDLHRALSEAGGTNLIAVKVGKQKAIPALARNIQYSIVKHNLLHVDFYAVVMDETVNVNVPIHVIGESELIKQEGGTLVTGINELEIEALPGNLPESIEVDISGIESFSKSISVADLTLPEDIIVHSSLESMVVVIQPPRLAEEEEEEGLEEEGLETSAEVPTIGDEQQEEE
jgi:large subunit ribosomal protein L25